jgi:tetratricopeptide (TPR) repeat protein
MSIQEPKTREEQESFVQSALERSEQLRRKKEYKEGISLLVEALKYGINKAMIYYRLGNLYIDGGDLGRAEYAYKRALEVDPHHVNAMHNLAIVYKRQQKISLYVKTYKKSQRMRIRYPRQANLSPKERSRLRRFGVKYLIWFLIGGALLVVILYLAVR